MTRRRLLDVVTCLAWVAYLALLALVVHDAWPGIAYLVRP